MYQRITLLFVLLCALPQYAGDRRHNLEIKPSYFFFSASPMNEIYDKGAFEIQGSGSVSIFDSLDFYGSVGYRLAWGHALNSGESTNLIVIPIDIGLKPIFNFSEDLSYFFAVGPRFFTFHQQNHSFYVNRIINGGGVGLFVNTGFNVQLVDGLLIGIFGEYSSEKTTVISNMQKVYSNGTVQIGGFAFGVSLGYGF